MAALCGSAAASPQVGTRRVPAPATHPRLATVFVSAPRAAPRSASPLSEAGALQQSQAEVFEVTPGAYLGIQSIIDGGTADTPPADDPHGAVQRLVSGADGQPFSRHSEPMDLSPRGNEAATSHATVGPLLARRAKLVYARSSGGESGSGCKLIVTRSG